jgi:hypothetical protein
MTMKCCCIAALFSLVCVEANAAVVIAVNCTSAAVQNAINAASSGDTVQLPGSCSATWSTAVSIPNTKGLVLNGNGATIARSGSLLISLSVNNSAPSRITGFAFTDPNSSSVGYFVTVGGGNETSAKFRIDHCTFTGLNGGVHIRISDSAYGVIDHNTFTWSNGIEVIHNEGYGSSSTAGWTNDVFPGSASAVYIEDNTFINQTSGNPAYFRGASAVQAYYGARTVIRHNAMTMAHVDQHGTAGMIGARWWEIYDNTFNIVPNGNQSDYMRLRAGSGVIFNNHAVGSENLGSGVIELLEEDTGYPALYQVGRGKNQVLDPAYVWNNDSDMPVGSGSSNVQEGRDYFLLPKPGYIPYTYPHPLATQGMVPPAAPQNVRILPQ